MDYFGGLHCLLNGSRTANVNNIYSKRQVLETQYSNYSSDNLLKN